MLSTNPFRTADADEIAEKVAGLCIDPKLDLELRHQMQAMVASSQAVSTAMGICESDAVKQLLAPPKNRPYYRQFAKGKF